MLNEIKEFNEYTFPITEDCDKDNGRLYYRYLIARDLTGLYRAMEIIARGFLFNRPEIADMPIEEKIPAMKQIFRMWNGAVPSDLYDLGSVINNWLPDYIKKMRLSKGKSYEEYLTKVIQPAKEDGIFNEPPLPQEKTKSGFKNTQKKYKADIKEASPEFFTKKDPFFDQYILIKYVLESLKRYNHKTFEHSLFSGDLSNTGNIEHLITYEKTIANALNKGPLKRYYLVARKGLFDNILYENETIRPAKNKHLEENTKIDRILKYTAAWLLNRQPECDFSVFNKVDVMNWANNKTDISMHQFLYKPAGMQEQLLICEEDKAPKNICRQWLEDYDIHIVEESEFTDPGNGYIFFSDQGANKYLNRYRLYRPKKTPLLTFE